MTLRQAATALALTLAALVLSGCFVISKNLPAGTGPEGDERLIGAWQGLDADSKKPADAFLHFQQQGPDLPLRLIWVEGRTYQIYEVTTRKIGNAQVFAVQLTGPEEAMKEEMPKGYYLGFYEFKSPDEVVFHLLDAKKVGELIEKGAVAGVKPARQYDWAELTGSSAELARFLASPQALAARIDDPAYLRRIARTPK